MMRTLILLFIGGVAGLIAYRAFTGECLGGAVVRSEAGCRSEQGLSAELCRTIFARALTVSRESGSVYADIHECRRLFGDCLDHATLNAVVPRPHGFCVKVDGAKLVSMVPVYRQAAAR